MTKHVFENSMVAHVWAQQSQTEGRSHNGQFYFEGDTIYSYGHHFPAAKLVKTKDGEQAVLLNDRKYSVSTSRHQSYVRQALAGGLIKFYVEDPSTSPEANIQAFDATIKDAIKAYGEAKREIKRKRIALDVYGLVNQRNAFGAAFIKKFKPMALPEDLSKARARIEAAEKREATLKRKKAEIAYEQGLQIAELNLGVSRDKWPDIWRNRQEDNYHGARDYLARASQYIRQKYGVLLRLRTTDDNGVKIVEEIETSQGARFPVKHGLKALPFIREVIARGEAWEKNGHKIALGHFEIDRIEPDGTVKAGCHTVAYSEIEAVAKQLGV